MRPAVATIAALLLSMAAPLVSHAQDAADAFYNPQAMDRARKALRHGTGGQTNYFLQADRFEVQSNEGEGLALFEAQGWVGGDYQRFWFKSEGEYAEGGELEEAEIQGLYSKAISSFFDVQAGVRQDVAPGTRRTFGVVGIQGLAPYWFEIDAALFISHEGDVSARFESEYDVRLTQRLIFQERAELNFAAQDVEDFSIGSGLSTLELGGRLRYEFKREFAPYIGISWTRAVGRTADFVRNGGGDPNSLSVVAGLRLWF